MILKEILHRRSVREFKSESVPEIFVKEIIEAGQFAPTARNNQAIEFIVIRNQETKDKIFEIVDQEFVKKALILIIPVSDTTKSGYPIQDLSVASENIFLQATAVGLGSVWKNLQNEWEEKIKQMLGIPGQYMAINIIPIGYPKEMPIPRSNEDFAVHKIHEEKW